MLRRNPACTSETKVVMMQVEKMATSRRRNRRSSSMRKSIIGIMSNEPSTKMSAERTRIKKSSILDIESTTYWLVGLHPQAQ